MFKVQANTPIPDVNYSPKPRGRRKYPFEEMAIGEMFFVPGRTTASIGAHVSAAGKALSRKFSTRQTTMRDRKGRWELCESDDPNAVTGVGVWRTE